MLSDICDSKTAKQSGLKDPKMLPWAFFSCVLTVLCKSVKAGSVPVCDQPTAAVFVWWITNRVCWEYNSLCLNFWTSSSTMTTVSSMTMSLLGISQSVWWIKVNVEAIYFFLMAGDICVRCSLWTRADGRWWPAVHWNSEAWCSCIKRDLQCVWLCVFSG